MTRLTAFGLILVFVAACGSVEPGGGSTSTRATEPPTSTPANVTSVGELQVIVPPNAQGEFPPDLLVSCGNGRFPIAALAEIRPLEEADPGGVAEAIAEFLANEEGQQWPQGGWQILHQTENEVQLVAEKDDGLLAFMSVSDSASGWTFGGASLPGDPCQLEFTVPDNLNVVEWRLDPETAEPTAESTRVSVILQERECVSGQEIGDRLVGPQIVMTGTKVFVAFTAKGPEGDFFDCQGNPQVPFVVELPEPIGDRELMEGLDLGIDLADYVD
jgi:hypothetical protein